MARAVEWYLLVTSLVVGLSHVLQPAAWAEAYAALHRAGRPGAFVNGALALATGAMVLGFHPVWSGPPLALTVFGWILVLKGAVCFLTPRRGLGSMAIGASGRGFVAGGIMLLAVGAWSGYCLWTGRTAS